ncbi:MAG: single-stranded DNA-binding protein [Candidatus Colwellbacteria bacterium]|nr:single-stranded DNA-binding protein [Candidatus Colwellbacteria bacterium]
MNLNKVYVIGRLTADPELRTTPTGESVASFSVATNRFWKSKEGEKRENTEFHNVVAWGRQAEIIHQFSKRGSIIMIEGRLQTRTWEGKDGQTRKTTEIVAENIQLGPRSGGPARDLDSHDLPPKEEKTVHQNVPTIDIEEGPGDDEIKPEDLPF